MTKLVYRKLGIPVPTFDYLCDYRRAHGGISNAEAIARILAEHKEAFAGEDHDQHRSQRRGRG